MHASITELTVDIVSAYVANNSISASDLSQLIVSTHKTLDHLVRAEPLPPSDAGKPVPAVPIKKSVTPDFLISLEDGKKYKSLKRHLRTHYGMSPANYREKWGLSDNYPMVAPNYAQQRSELAKRMGLGRKPGGRKPAKK